MCQIDGREGTVSFAAIRRVLRELFAKNHGGSIRPPLQVRGLTLLLVGFLDNVNWGGGRFDPLDISKTLRPILMGQTPFDCAHREVLD